MVRFVVDSTFGITREYALEHKIEIVGLTLTLDGKEYTEGFRDEWDEFYTAYSRSKSAAKTSQPSPDKFIAAIEKIYGEDPQAEVLVLTIGDRLSGTIGSANIAVMQFPEKRVASLDSHNGGISSLMLLRELVESAESGADLVEVKSLALRTRDRISTKFIPDSLTELARGGRVNKLLSRVGNILNIKPVFEYKGNELNVLSRSLGSQRAINFAVNSVPKDYAKLAVLYIYDDTLAKKVCDKLYRVFGLSHIDIEPMCPVGGAHIGIGTAGIVVMEKSG